MQFKGGEITFSTKGTGEIGHPQAKRKNNNLVLVGVLQRYRTEREREKDIVCVQRKKEREIYFKKLACVVVEAGKSKSSGQARRSETQGRADVEAQI